MKLSFTARRRLQRIGIICLVLLLLASLAWTCWVIWAERYVVYDADGAHLNFDILTQVSGGQLAVPPDTEETVPVWINEGSNAVNTSTELTQVSGYYIDADTLQNDLQTAKNIVASLPAGTTVMLELKNIWGSFMYTSLVPEATMSTKLNTADVDALITEITSRNLYAVAKIPAFRERYYFLVENSNTVSGFAQKGKGYLWADSEKCYWMNPTDHTGMNWLKSIVEELKTLGFDEVVLSEFRIPTTDQITISGDATEIISTAAADLVSSCATERFTVSFMTSDIAFPLPQGRSRLYLESVSAKNVDAIATQTGIVNPEVNLIFMTNTPDTRFETYGVLRPVAMYNGNT